MHKVIFGDVRKALKTLPDEIVQTTVTSPPYFGPREYHTQQQKWADGWIGELGRERSPVQYVNHLREVFGEVYRVTREGGTLWLNIGDCYAKRRYTNERDGITLKKKDLIGIPHMTAFALRDSGWTLKSDIVWEKPNVLPSGGTNERCGSSKEYIFMFAKGGNNYFDMDSIREPVKVKSTGSIKYGGKKYPDVKGGVYSGKEYINVGTRCKRDVWRVTVKGTKELHYATFNTDLISPCILSGTSEYGCCSKCGAPYKRIVELGDRCEDWMKQCGADSHLEYKGENQKDYEKHGAQEASTTKRGILSRMRERKTVGWKPTCTCGRDPVPCIVLDPFLGSGTTSLAAKMLGRSSIGTELNRDYEPIIKKRLGTDGIEYHFL